MRASTPRAAAGRPPKTPYGASGWPEATGLHNSVVRHCLWGKSSRRYARDDFGGRFQMLGRPFLVLGTAFLRTYADLSYCVSRTIGAIDSGPVGFAAAQDHQSKYSSSSPISGRLTDSLGSDGSALAPTLASAWAVVTTFPASAVSTRAPPGNTQTIHITMAIPENV